MLFSFRKQHKSHINQTKSINLFMADSCLKCEHRADLCSGGRMNRQRCLSVGLFVLFDSVYKRHNRWDSGNETFLEEPQTFCLCLALTQKLNQDGVVGWAGGSWWLKHVNSDTSWLCLLHLYTMEMGYKWEPGANCKKVVFSIILRGL